MRPEHPPLLMHTVVLGLVILLCICDGSTWAQVRQTVTLACDGKAMVTIVVLPDADAAVRDAAADLATYIEKCSGVAVPVRNDGAAVEGAGIYVGRCALSVEQDLPPIDGLSESKAREAYAVRMRGGNVFLTGRTDAAVAYAVYAFTERELGVRWFAPGNLWEHVPPGRAGQLSVMVEPRVVVPDISLRIWSGHEWFDSWKRWDYRNRARSRSEPIFHRRGNQLQGAFPVERFGETHPEYYPLIDGKRFVPPPGPLDRHSYFWPCSSNPEVVRVAADFIRDWFNESPVERRSFSMGMDDVTKICECDACRALDPPGAFEKQQFSDRNYAFVNAVARRIKQTHPDHAIGVLIYRQLRRPPSTIERMEDNVYGFITQNCASWWAEGNGGSCKTLVAWASGL